MLSTHTIYRSTGSNLLSTLTINRFTGSNLLSTHTIYRLTGSNLLSTHTIDCDNRNLYDGVSFRWSFLEKFLMVWITVCSRFVCLWFHRRIQLKCPIKLLLREGTPMASRPRKGTVATCPGGCRPLASC